MVNWIQSLYRLYFEDDLVGYDDIYPLIAKKLVSVHNGNPFFSLERKPRDIKLDADCARTDAFQQSGPEFPMNRNATADDFRHDLFQFIRE
jgi:hypothetical protein